MSSLRVRRLLRRHRRRLVLVFAVIAVGGVVAAHHAPGMEMGMGHAGMAMVICLGVVPLLGTVAVLRRSASWPRPAAALSRIAFPPLRAGWATCIEPRARAGPPSSPLVLRL